MFFSLEIGPYNPVKHIIMVQINKLLLYIIVLDLLTLVLMSTYFALFIHMMCIFFNLSAIVTYSLIKHLVNVLSL